MSLSNKAQFTSATFLTFQRAFRMRFLTSRLTMTSTKNFPFMLRTMFAVFQTNTFAFTIFVRTNVTFVANTTRTKNKRTISISIGLPTSWITTSSWWPMLMFATFVMMFAFFRFDTRSFTVVIFPNISLFAFTSFFTFMMSFLMRMSTSCITKFGIKLMLSKTF